MAPTTLLTLGSDSFPFENHQQLHAWLNDELSKWTWLSEATNAGNIWNQVRGNLNELASEVTRHQHNSQPLHVIISTIEARFRNQIVYSGSTEGERILQILHRLGPDAAAAALGFYRLQTSLGDVRGLSALRGIMAFAYPATTPIDDVLNDLIAERKRLRDTVKELNRQFESSQVQQRADVARLISQQTRASKRLKRIGRRLWREEVDYRKEAWLDLTGDVEEALSKLDKQDETYSDKLALDAPVTYWRRKARVHGLKEAAHLRNLRFYFGASGAVILTVFYLAAERLNQFVTVPTQVLIVAGAGLAVFAAMVLWVARILTRLYLSEHHLRSDAEERATMANAFLALRHKADLEPADRAFVLQALFRPTSDGIVRDDGPPDLNAIIALSKLGMPGPAGRP